MLYSRTDRSLEFRELKKFLCFGFLGVLIGKSL